MGVPLFLLCIESKSSCLLRVLVLGPNFVFLGPFVQNMTLVNKTTFPKARTNEPRYRCYVPNFMIYLSYHEKNIKSRGCGEKSESLIVEPMVGIEPTTPSLP